MKMLNIGCGKIYHTDWINLDLVSSPGIKGHNIKKRLPFPDNSLDFVYHSHILEHLRQNEAKKFIKECYRILKPEGLIRIAVPDLEKLCEEYLKNLKKGFDNGDENAILDYQWNKQEMFDQMIREKQGGKILEIIESSPTNKAYIASRIGQTMVSGHKYLSPKPSKKLIRATKKILLLIIRLKLLEAFSYAKRTLLNNFFFNSAGEKHYWAYDRLDLKIILEEV
ncbi:MAG: methyltransferase domain-containing protein [Patescibacteria group bacterium]